MNGTRRGEFLLGSLRRARAVPRSRVERVAATDGSASRKRASRLRSIGDARASRPRHVPLLRGVRGAFSVPALPADADGGDREGGSRSSKRRQARNRCAASAFQIQFYLWDERKPKEALAIFEIEGSYRAIRCPQTSGDLTSIPRYAASLMASKNAGTRAIVRTRSFDPTSPTRARAQIAKPSKAIAQQRINRY